MDDMAELNPRQARTLRGFTLVELMIVVALSSVVLALALSTLTNMTREMRRVESTTAATDEAKRLGDWLSTRLISTGGGLVRPWAAIAVENAWGASGSDRLTFAVAEDLDHQCSVESVSGDEVVLQTSGTCCVDASIIGTQALLISSATDTDPYRILRQITDVDEAACTAELGGSATPVDADAPDDSDWEGGVLAVVRAQRIWLDEGTRILKVDEDQDLDGTWETRIAADRIFDLQLALGYDAPLWDWRLADTASTGDEWLFNAAGDAFASVGQGLAKARSCDLRMIRIGVLVGAPDPTGMPAAALSLLDGPERQETGWILRDHLGTTGLRNYDVMR